MLLNVIRFLTFALRHLWRLIKIKMSNLLSDFLNDKIEPLQQGGFVNGLKEFDLPSENSESESEGELDNERDKYVLREIKLYNQKEEVDSVSHSI